MMSWTASMLREESQFLYHGQLSLILHITTSCLLTYSEYIHYRYYQGLPRLEPNLAAPEILSLTCDTSQCVYEVLCLQNGQLTMYCLRGLVGIRMQELFYKKNMHISLKIPMTYIKQTRVFRFEQEWCTCVLLCKCLHEEPIFINSQLKTKQVWFMFLQCHLGIKLTRMKRQWIHSRVWIFFISKCKDKTNNDALYTFLNIHQSDIDLLCNQRTVKRRYLFLNQ